MGETSSEKLFQKKAYGNHYLGCILTKTIVEVPVIAKTVQMSTISRYQEKVHLSGIFLASKNPFNMDAKGDATASSTFVPDCFAEDPGFPFVANNRRVFQAGVVFHLANNFDDVLQFWTRE